MKKTVLFLIGLALILLSGCGKEPNETFLVSAIHFENDNGKFLVTAEYICVPDTDTESGFTAKTTSATAERADFAINRLSGGMTKELKFEHCAVVILNENLSAKQTDEIFNLLTKSEIPLSARLTFTEERDVFLAKTDSNPSVGYALSSLLKSREELFGYGVHTRIYEIDTARKQENNIFAIPFVNLSDDKLSAEGMMLYREDIPFLKLDMKESVYYAMARNTYEGGFLEQGEEILSQKATKIKECEKKGEMLTLKINLDDKKTAKELEDFLNRLIKDGINIFNSRGIKSVRIKEGG